MKIKLVSDCHLESSELEIPNDKEYDLLILSGDIMTAAELHDYPDTTSVDMSNYRMVVAARYRKFLSQVSADFPKVIYVAGNHEFYRGRFHASLEHLLEECSKYPNVYFLEKDYIIIDDTAFIGGTLWTDCNNSDPHTLFLIKNMMNDYRLIKDDRNGFRRISPEDTVKRHKETLQCFQKIINQVKSDGVKKIVIVAHHSPSHLSIHQQYADDYYMNGGYHSNLGSFITDNPEIVLFTHGHTHHAFDYNIGPTRVICNPRGYVSERYTENTGWDPNIEINI